MVSLLLLQPLLLQYHRPPAVSPDPGHTLDSSLSRTLEPGHTVTTLSLLILLDFSQVISSKLELPLVIFLLFTLYTLSNPTETKLRSC